jgi:hypothetical protein
MRRLRVAAAHAVAQQVDKYDPREKGSGMSRRARALVAALLVIAVIGLVLATLVANVR